MSNPLEINLKIGEKEHRLAIEPGDRDGATETLDRVGFMVDLFINGTPGTGKRAAAKPVDPKKPVTPPTPSGTSAPAGGAK